MKAIGSQHRTCRIVKSTGVYYRYKCSFSDCDWIVNASKRKLKKGKKSSERPYTVVKVNDIHSDGCLPTTPVCTARHMQHMPSVRNILEGNPTASAKVIQDTLRVGSEYNVDNMCLSSLYKMMSKELVPEFGILKETPKQR